MSVYHQAQLDSQAKLRAVILEQAIEILHAEGVKAMTMRAIAARAGASTKVLYTMFGGKQGLIDALRQTGFDQLRLALTAVPADLDSQAYGDALAAAYRDFALARPEYYRVMFEQVIPHYEPGPLARSAAAAAFQVQVDAIARWIDIGVFRPGDPYEMAKIFWAALHGSVSLELSGHFPGDKNESRYRTLLGAVANAFLADPEPEGHSIP